MAAVGVNDFRSAFLPCMAKCTSVYAFVFILGKADCSLKPWCQTMSDRLVDK